MTPDVSRDELCVALAVSTLATHNGAGYLTTVYRLLCPGGHLDQFWIRVNKLIDDPDMQAAQPAACNELRRRRDRGRAERSNIDAAAKNLRQAAT